ncbi:MAG: ABC transporter ATP-binding protein [archaeon]|nr:ABC transporter ATP-binding protein [archaeon]
MPKAIETVKLVKDFKITKSEKRGIASFFFPKKISIRAVDNISLNIEENEIFGLLGPNGAGKTSLIKLMTGLLNPTSGNVKIFSKPIEKQKNQIGLMLGYDMIYYRLTGYDNLKYFAQIYGVKEFDSKISELSKMLGLNSRLDDYVENYSLGMKSKLAMARALIHEPKVLFLDEPTLGLDPAISIEIRKYIKKLNKTVFLTTHYVEEAMQLCNRIAIMHKGQIIKINSPEKFGNITQEFISLTEEDSNGKEFS